MNTVSAQAAAAGPVALHEPRYLGDVDIEQLRQHVPVTRRRLEAGQHLYRAGQPFNALFLVNVGCLKTCELSDDGREQVTGFRMRGDLIGAESIGLRGYACDVVALEAGEVWNCRIRRCCRRACAFPNCRRA